jgi:hypothetical protein
MRTTAGALDIGEMARQTGTQYGTYQRLGLSSLDSAELTFGQLLPFSSQIIWAYEANEGMSIRAMDLGKPLSFCEMAERGLHSASTLALLEPVRIMQNKWGVRSLAESDPALASRPYDRLEIETSSGKAVRAKDATKRWDEFLGKEQTNIDPRDGLVDPDRIWSADGTRSIRFGNHEMNSSPNKFHYHEETWYGDRVANVLQRVQK